MGITHYWAIVERSSDGYYVHFPDLPGATAAGDIIDGALSAAADVANHHIDSMIADGRLVPEPTSSERLPRDPEVEVYTISLVSVRTRV